MTTSLKTKRKADFVDDPDYRNHPAVLAGVKLYSQFKKQAMRRKNRDSSVSLSQHRELMARELSFRNFFQAQRFYRKYQPADYEAVTAKGRRKAEKRKL